MGIFNGRTGGGFAGGKERPRPEIDHTPPRSAKVMYEGWNFNSGNYLFTTDTK